MSASLSSPASIFLTLLIPWWYGHAPDLLYAGNPLENWETEYSQRGVIDLSLLLSLLAPIHSDEVSKPTGNVLGWRREGCHMQRR